MRGLIFTQFLEMVETHYSADMVDDIIEDSQIPSAGIYTAVSDYSHQELHDLCVALAARSNQTLSEILKEYGEYVFAPLYQTYQKLFRPKNNALQFLLEVDSDIHKEMRKLYPEAKLPNIECTMQGNHLIMRYQSDRHFADLVHGLIIGCGNYFNEPLDIEVLDFSEGQATYKISVRA